MGSGSDWICRVYKVTVERWDAYESYGGAVEAARGGDAGGS